jgi:hypothetical protein
VNNKICQLVQDTERTSLDDTFLKALVKFIARPTMGFRRRVVTEAKNNFGGHVSNPQTLNDFLGSLLTKNKQIWAELLRATMRSPEYFVRLQRLSPFKNFTLIFFQHPHGEANLAPYTLSRGPFQKSTITFGDKFIAIPNKDLTRSTIFNI